MGGTFAASRPGLPPRRLDRLRGQRHRLAREAKIAQVMKALPNGDLDDWLPMAYDDVPEAIWPVARSSLEAHVERLRTL